MNLKAELLSAVAPCEKHEAWEGRNRVNGPVDTFLTRSEQTNLSPSFYDWSSQLLGYILLFHLIKLMNAQISLSMVDTGRHRQADPSSGKYRVFIYFSFLFRTGSHRFNTLELFDIFADEAGRLERTQSSSSSVLFITQWRLHVSAQPRSPP